MLKPAFSGQDQTFARAFDLLREGIAAQAFPGAVLAVVWRGELVALKALGRFTYDADATEVAADSIYDLASVTKIVATTATAMVLYERGLLDLDMPARAALPEFAGADPRRDEVSVRDLLAHTSGLPAYVRLFESCKTREELVRAACRTPLEAAPGERTCYSDIGFIVLGEVLAHLADEALDSFCRREIFGRLGMTETGFNPPAAWKARIPPSEQDRTFRKRVIEGEVNDENAAVMNGVAGHAGVFAAAMDVARFAATILENGGALVRPETLRVFAQKHPAKSGEARALGFDVPTPPSQAGQYFSPGSLGHLGFTGCSLWTDLERGLAVVLLTNRTWPDRSSKQIQRVRPQVHDAVCEALGLGG